MDNVYTIGVLIGNANSPHTMDLMQGIYRASKKLNVNLLFFLGIHSRYHYRSYFGEQAEDDYDYQFNIVYDYAWLGKVDALIISYGSLCIFLDDADKTTFLNKFSGIPYILLEDRDETMTGSSIISDNYHGMFQLVEHLVTDHGYRDFTYLSGPADNTDAIERKRAFLDVLAQYQIPFDESRIAYGDYSSCVEPQINELLDRFPHMQAMVCANDIMADTVYHECAKRGIVVGRDLAVTGYDDWEVSKSMNPPLTTVLQDAYDMGYMAVIGALELCSQKSPHAVAVVIPAEVKFRNSCGCTTPLQKSPSLSNLKQFLDQIFGFDFNQGAKRRTERDLGTILRHDFTDPSNWDTILIQLKQFLESDLMDYISPSTLSDAFCGYFHTIPAASHSSDALSHLKEEIQSAILAYTLKKGSQNYAVFQNEASFLPLISRDMMNHIEDEKEFFHFAMTKLPALHCKSAYLYLFEEPIVHKKQEPWICPQNMYLAAFHIGDQITSFAENERPVLSAQNGIGSFHQGEAPFSLSIFCLFSGDEQYGILAAEIAPSSLVLTHLISMQIGNALKFRTLSRKQRATQNNLEKLVQEIKEKNELLNYISEYDALTRCLNRRGFVEQAMALNREHSGKNAVLVFADVDHLKEINDCFGHKEGDFAIRFVAETLRHALKDCGIVGRIGGDEFVVLICPCNADSAKTIIGQIQAVCENFNHTSEKEYYVELSMGQHAFLCGQDISLPEVLGKADDALYTQKAKRRQSVLKNAEN
ncbi:MAG: GGDEF domain-containing protein [Lachnospiraceae bacterium]|nr:GGDEF domain-containing protein [Lachnospiraceae bacterium]